jgi:predicted O-methyltransferase YrrM
MCTNVPRQAAGRQRAAVWLEARNAKTTYRVSSDALERRRGRLPTPDDIRSQVPAHSIRSVASHLARHAYHLGEWYRGKRDGYLFGRAFPRLEPSPALIQRSRCELEPYYSEYVAEVSTPLMAISLELSVLLDALCTARLPRRLLDLGSGFSSLVFRRYAGQAGAGVDVQSVDHDAEWLACTRRYLEHCGVSVTGLSTWREFRSRQQSPFDLILHDLGGPGDDHIGYRLAVLPDVLDMLAPDGILVLDDAHLSSLGPAARRLLDTHSFRYWSLKAFVQDDFHRWAMLTTR